MELIERYLQAVRFWLPKEQKHDIIAELSEDIHEQIAERESTLERALNESEVEAILKQRGHPMLVANRYLPQQSLIGPVLFPVYCFLLKIIAAGYLASAVFWTVIVAFNHAYPAGHGDRGLRTALSSFWSTAFITTAVVTLVFAVIERLPQIKSRIFEEWSPGKLPPVRHFNLITRPAALFELAVNLLMTTWWADNMYSPLLWNQGALQISLAPVWPYFFWSFLAVGLINTALSAANLIRPYWTGLKASVRLVSDCAGAILFCLLLKANIVTGLVIANVSPDRAQQITGMINMWTVRMLPPAIVVAFVIALTGIVRLVRLKTTRLRFPWEATVPSTLPLG